jgi:beta-lactamase regulating signal transducer with metallopeptidase domain
MRETIGLTLLHFLWQGAAIALLLMMANLRKAGANVRYTAACCALAAMAICCAGTFLYLIPSVPEAVSGQYTGSSVVVLAGKVNISGPGRSGTLLECLSYAWLLGVIVLSVRSFGSWIAAQQLRTSHVRPAPDEWLNRARRIADRLAIRRTIAVLESGVAEVPAVIGWIRPVVLIPLSNFAGLDGGQLEALLAHELAHVRRHDYLVNLLQTAVETLLFFHPAVWWVSRIIRTERENCCDDLAVSVCGDRVRYARALAALEQLRCQRFALAATDGSLLKRIERLLGRDAVEAGSRLRWIPVAVLSVFAILLAGAQVRPKQQTKPSPIEFTAPAADAQASQTVPHEQPEQHENAIEEPGPEPQTKPPQGQESKEDYIESLASAGMRGLTVDQLIAMKIHGVNATFIQEMKGLGFNLPVDELVAFKIHGVTAEFVNQMKSQGWQLTADQLVAFRIHGVESDAIGKLRSMGFEITADQAVATRIHGITPDFASSWKALGLKGLDIEKLIALKIHGADPAMVREYSSLGFQNMDIDKILAVKIMGVTPEFVREVQKRGFQNLTLDQVIQLRQMNIIPLNTK